LMHSVTVEINIKMGKTSDLSDLERGMMVGASHAGSSISETTVSRVYRERCDKQKTSSQWRSCWRKQLVDERSKENDKNCAS
jgi:hypothetical protein